MTLAARGGSLPSPKRAEPARLLRCSSVEYAEYSPSSRLAAGPAAPISARSDFHLGLLARLLLLAAALLSATAHAAPKRPPAAAHDPKQEKAARAHFDRAEKAFNLGHFDDALAGYQAAYEALPLPAFLFNIAQCHRNLRNREQAVFFYQRYLSLAPDAPNRGVVEELIAEQKRLLEYERPDEPEEKRLDLTPRPEPADRTVARLNDQPAQQQDQSKWKKARWYLLGALGVALIGGVALLSVRRSGELPTGELGAIDTR